jgi:hypothetical protein
MKNQFTTYILAGISLLLLIYIFNTINFLVKNNYITSSFDKTSKCKSCSKEGFDPRYTQTVDMPLTTTTTCRNFCSPTSRCAITGQQCFADIDCPGCQSRNKQIPNLKETNIIGDNDAGKLTYNQTPQYSILTTDIGTQATIYDKEQGLSLPQHPNLGRNTWIKRYHEDKKIFDARYKPPKLEFMVEFPERKTLSGEFKDEGPLAANAYL